MMASWKQHKNIFYFIQQLHIFLVLSEVTVKCRLICYKVGNHIKHQKVEKLPFSKKLESQLSMPKVVTYLPGSGIVALFLFFFFCQELGKSLSWQVVGRSIIFPGSCGHLVCKELEKTFFFP
jgi:hypothetical protein